MRAITFASYGGPDVLEVTDQPDPLVGPDTVLVRVRAVSVNPVDHKIREGYLQGAFPSRLPIISGWDVAGVVEAVGPAVTAHAVGDEVIGYVRKDSIGLGTYAELVGAGERHLAPKPTSVTFAEGAGLPLAGLTALQTIERADVGRGDVVLVHAAAGGVGHLAVQIAAARGARVIGTAGPRNQDFVRALGAEPVEYGEGLADRVRALAPQGVDVALDSVGGESIAVSAAVVRDPSRIVSVIDPGAVTAVGGRYAFVRPDAGQLTTLSRMVDAGSLRVELAQTFAFEQAADAQRLVEEGHVRGKVAITVG
jgi:NADPH:quinone reductase-like Zn-dependent oxidoreductase